VSYLGDDVTPYIRRRRGDLRRRLAVLTRGPQPRDHLAEWAARAVALAAGLSAAASAVIYLLFTLYLYRVPFLQLWALGMALFLLPWTLRLLHGPPPEPEPDFDPGAADLPPRPFAQVERWRRQLETTDDDVERFSRVVQPRLVELVGLRLRLRYGIRMRDEPDRARAILGPALHDFLTGTLPRVPTPHELDLLITRMEEF
jgi:hypothetical protein